MLPIVGVPATIRQGMAQSRDLFCREAGFEHISRYRTGLLLSPHKPLQGISALQVWGEEQTPSRRARHEAVFEAGWAADALLPHPRQVMAPDHRGRGREVLSLDWPDAHHERGLKMWGVKQAWDHVQQRLTPDQTVGTAVVANREFLDGVEGVGQQPARHAEEDASLQETVRQRSGQRAEARGRLLALLYHPLHRVGDKKRTERAVDIVRQRDQEGHFPQAHYAFDNGVLTVDLTRGIESVGQHWVREVERSRHIQWHGQWRRVDDVAAALRSDHPESVRSLHVRCRHGETKTFWVFTKVIRLTRYGRKRLVIVHEKATLEDEPRFVLTDALPGERGRVSETWSDRWTAEIFHEVGKQVTGLEAAQVRKEEAVTRHVRLRGVAQSLLQRAPASGTGTARVAFATGEATCGQRSRAIVREALHGLLQCVAQLFLQGRSCTEVLEIFMPA